MGGWKGEYVHGVYVPKCVCTVPPYLGMYSIYATRAVMMMVWCRMVWCGAVSCV